MRKGIALVFALVASVACGGSSQSGSGVSAAVPTPSRNANRDLITRAEIDEAQGVTTMYDLIQRLRPQYFRQARVLVRLNGQLVERDMLRSILPNTIEEVRFYSIVEAETKWAGDRGSPVIALTTRR